MTAALKSIAETVEQLPAKERAYLAERLIASLDEAELESAGPMKPFAAVKKSAPAK